TAKQSTTERERPGSGRKGNGARHAAANVNNGVAPKRKSAAPPNWTGRNRSSDWEDVPRPILDEVEQFVDALKAIKQGDFSVRLQWSREGILGHAGELLNDIVALNQHTANELLRVGEIVGQEGRMTERVSVGPASGSWAASMNAVNQ